MNEQSMTVFLIEKTIMVLSVFGGVMLVVALTTLVERRVAGFIQDRYGPNRAFPSHSGNLYRIHREDSLSEL